MARVVQRRTNPPYLLILFVFLFLIATALAVLFYINADKAAKDLAADRANFYKVMGPADEDAAAKTMRDVFANNKSHPTIVQQLREQVTELARGITPETPNSYETAKTALDQTHDKYKDYTSLTALVDRFSQESARNEARVRELGDERRTLINEKDQLAKDRDELMAKQKKDLQELSDQLKQLDEKFAANHTDYQGQLGKIKDEINSKLAEYEKNINDKIALIAKQKREIDQKDVYIAMLKEEITKLKGGDVASAIRPTPDGKIIKLLDSDHLAYVNIGSKDNVKIGLTLAVYPFTGIPENASAPKGRLRVVNVYADTSECMVSEESNKDPLSVDDVVSNLAHDSVRTFTFVVDGMFDLRGTGAASPNGLDEVKELIRQSGGKVADAVDIQTDFVVLGEVPPVPPRPADPTPQVERVYREQLKAIEHYKEIEKTAKDLKIPTIINTNRFLALMGYVAPKTNK